MPAAKKKPAPVAREAAETGTALIQLETLKAVEIFQPNGCQQLIEIIEAEVEKFVPDIATEEGRKAIARLDRTIASSKVGVSAMATELTEGWRKKTGEVNAERKRFVDRCEELQEEVSAPLEAWKKAEADRVEALNNRLEQIKALDAHTAPGEASASLQQRLKSAAELYVNHDWQDFAELAQETYTAVTASLQVRLDHAIGIEAQQAELKRLQEESAAIARKAEEERIAREAEQKAKDDHAASEEQARKDAEARVKAEGERAAVAEATAKQAVIDKQKAEDESAQKAKDAAEKATKDEQDRQQKIKDDAAAEEKRLAADKAHRGAINRAALTAIRTAAPTLGEADAIAILTAIVNGKVPQVSITYTVKP